MWHSYKHNTNKGTQTIKIKYLIAAYTTNTCIFEVKLLDEPFEADDTDSEYQQSDEQR